MTENSYLEQRASKNLNNEKWNKTISKCADEKQTVNKHMARMCSISAAGRKMQIETTVSLTSVKRQPLRNQMLVKMWGVLYTAGGGAN